VENLLSKVYLGPGVYRGPPDVYRGPPEVYRGPCMKITPLNSPIIFTGPCRLRPNGHLPQQLLSYCTNSRQQN